MPSRTLGLDLGPTSIGWALIDEEHESIIASGARHFPEGVDRDPRGAEKSKSQTRREARGTRRQIARRARRKRRLRDFLVAAGLLPADTDALDRVLALSPYRVRRRALDERLEPHEIGRAILHLNERRGFRSNRKIDRARARKTRGMLAEITELADAVRQSDSRTLGEYLATLHERFDRTSPDSSGKVRARHTRRDMYEQEFEMIWDAQRPHHTDLLTPDRRNEIRRIMFFQRDMYSPRSVVGSCELEPKCKRCRRANRAAQRFRILQEVNNLRILDGSAREERGLTDDERGTLTRYLSDSTERTFDQIRRKLTLNDRVRFNLEGPERLKLKGHVTDAQLSGSKRLGRKRWKALPEQTKDEIVAVVIEEDREDVALKRLTQECGLDRDEAERALGANLPDGYMSVSREAITKLLPHLEKGMPLMGEDRSNSALHAAGYLRPDERNVARRALLPPSPDLPNPIVRRALVDVRKLVNAVIRQYGLPQRIRVELARETKKSFQQRTEIRFENAKRQRRREAAAEHIQELGYQPNGATISRYVLWQEQEEECVYCGRKIGLGQLFGGDADLDHILPRWRSLDDSLANKLVVHRKCNAAKGDRTPWEWVGESDPDAYERILQRARKLPYNKQRKMQQKEVVLDHFVNRQLCDTAYISRCVTQYLRCLGSQIDCTRGQMTADLRHWWGLDTILDPGGKGRKNRADHRHHAIDAVVIALTDSKRLHALANARGKNMPTPWRDFHQAVKHAIGEINVSHRASRQLRGALHEATIYGSTLKHDPGAEDPSIPSRPWAKGWIENEATFVRRKPLTALTNTRQLGKVRDVTIREILLRHLRQRGIDGDEPARIPADAFKGANTPRMPSGVPIKRVRMLVESKTFRRVSHRRRFQYVKPGSNHHIVYRTSDDGGAAKWTAEVITMWDAALLGRDRQPIVNRSDTSAGRFVMSLSIGEMFQIDEEGGRRVLCVVRKMDQDSRRLHYKLHTDARQDAEIKKDNLYLTPVHMQKRNARKVTVDLLGRIRRAGG